MPPGWTATGRSPDCSMAVMVAFFVDSDQSSAYADTVLAGDSLRTTVHRGGELLSEVRLVGPRTLPEAAASEEGSGP